jgi:23S rRNA-/tRNA-specific pseudouridylate synthase
MDDDLTSLAFKYIVESTGHAPKFLAACNRLDRDTSGLVVFALKKSSVRHINEQFEKRTVKKTYRALSKPLLEGGVAEFISKYPLNKCHTISGYLKKMEGLRFSLSQVKSEGKYSKTDFKIVNANDDENLLEFLLMPTTGRTHQLRVHLLSVGMPIVGDQFYGGSQDANLLKGDQLLYLHAESLELKHPQTGEDMVFEAPVSW